MHWNLKPRTKINPSLATTRGEEKRKQNFRGPFSGDFKPVQERGKTTSLAASPGLFQPLWSHCLLSSCRHCCGFVLRNHSPEPNTPSFIFASCGSEHINGHSGLLARLRADMQYQVHDQNSLQYPRSWLLNCCQPEPSYLAPPVFS